MLAEEVKEKRQHKTPPHKQRAVTTIENNEESIEEAFVTGKTAEPQEEISSLTPIAASSKKIYNFDTKKENRKKED